MGLQPTYEPPKIAVKLLSLVCKNNLFEEIEGDLYEYYQSQREEKSKRVANLHYWFHMFNFIRPFAIKKLGQNSNTIIMYRSYFKFAWRGMLRQKLQTSFHLLGLIVAFCVCGFIYSHIKYESSYDSFLDNADDIYRVAWMSENPQTRTPHPMAQALVNDFPEVIDAVSISPIYGPGLTKTTIPLRNEKRDVGFSEPNGYFADSTFFDVFSFKAVEGNADKALRKPFGIILSESMAKRYFGDEEAVGQTLSFMGNPDMLEVAAVVEDAPKNSHFHYNFIISYVTLKSLQFNDPWMSWDDFGHFNYLKLAPGTEAKAFEAKIPDWAPKYLDWGEESLASLKAGDLKFELQPVQSIHLHSNIRWELEANGSYSYLLIYGISALFILLISIINFVNLNTAKAAQRLKEVGVKKTLGAYKSQVFSQFIFEALFTTFLALVLSFVAMYMLEAPFNQLVNGNVSVADLYQADIILLLLSIAIITALLSAIYPSLYLNSFEAGQILKGLKLSKLGGNNIRNGLLAVQLIAAIVMISGSLVIKHQITFLKEKDLGFKQDNLMVLEVDGYDPRTKLVKTELLKNSAVSGITAVSNIPGGQFNQHPIYAENNPSERVDASEMFVDDDVAEVLGLKVSDGRMLSKAYAADSAGRSFVLNQSAINQLNLTDPIGKQLVWQDNENLVKGTIVGTVEDFHFRSLHEPIRPMIMLMQPLNSNFMLVKVNPTDLSQTVSKIEADYKEIIADGQFSYQFLDTEIQDLYKEESRTLKLITLLSAISILLACGGLLGIISIVIKQRVKEISIRKIMGASASQILWLMNFKYLLIAGVSLLIAVPVSVYFMKDWLSNFTYQIGIDPLAYVLTAIAVLFLIGFTITLISMKTVKSNPVNALRSE
ncbi:ABC transporter permease [Roseivirga sp.]|uniref:ABC transporter permease n=1 Tax=Roseivirga sp. TaxID=1964215 RepID=UPI002B270A57|nr:FtsX-like permease family protein [Roseivirga sp.]